MRASTFVPISLLLSWFAACAAPESAPRADSRAEPAAAHTAITTAGLEPYTCGSVQRLHTFQGLFLASQPQAADFEQARDGGVKTVVDLRPAGESRGFDEGEVVTQLGLAYENLPFGSAADLDDALFDRARELFATVQRPALFHCSSGNRVGAVWIPYRVLDGGIGIEEAVAEAEAIGLKSPEYAAKARDYVSRHAAQ